MSDLVRDVQGLQDFLRRQQEEVESIRSRLDRSEKRNAEQQERTAQLIHENATLHNVVNTHHQRMTEEMDLTRELQQAQQECSRLEASVHQQEMELDKVKDEFREENAKLERTVADQKQKIEYLHSKCKESESSFHTDLSQLEKSYEEKLKQMTQAMEQVENEKRKVEETLNKERQERSLASYNRTNNPESIDLLKSRILKMKTELAKVTKERDALKRGGREL